MGTNSSTLALDGLRVIDTKEHYGIDYYIVGITAVQRIRVLPSSLRASCAGRLMEEKYNHEGFAVPKDKLARLFAKAALAGLCRSVKRAVLGFIP